MHWWTLGIIVYVAILILVYIRILFETRSTTKTLAYLLLTLFVPVFGIGFYMLFGFNYWRKRRYNRKIEMGSRLQDELRKSIHEYNESFVAKKDEALTQNVELAAMLVRDIGSPLTRNNKVKILVNGEEKFPDLLDAIRNAKKHIHIEYYIFDYDEIGETVINLLVEKAKEGVEVRLIYDDFGSPQIKKKTEKKIRDAGGSIYPFHKVNFYLLANRLNYRNHRKIVVIDGKTAFTGGINVSDKYINNGKNKLFWRDTHLRIDGPAVYYLQFLFLSDWNFCSSRRVTPEAKYFPHFEPTKEGCYAQIAASGPDSMYTTILYSILEGIYLAKEEILLTTPYFIPGDSIVDALCAAALSGIKVKLLVPGKSDSRFVNAAARSFYNTLLRAGVEIYCYQKGFIHAKTMVSDGLLSMVGTANMDHRSFELNFEVNAIIYDKKIAEELRNQFFDDLNDAVKIETKQWLSRSRFLQFPEKVARLFSPVM
jgi:cardiolipin synthase